MPPPQEQQQQQQESSAIVVGVVIKSEDEVSGVGSASTGKMAAAAGGTPAAGTVEATQPQAAPGPGAADSSALGAPLPHLGSSEPTEAFSTQQQQQQQQQRQAASFRPVEVSLLPPAEGKETSSGQPYTVVGGDSILSISQAHGISVQDLKAWNGLTTDLIYPGRVLIVTPRAEAAAAAEPPAAAAATLYPTEEEGPSSTPSTAKPIAPAGASQPIPPSSIAAGASSAGSALDPAPAAAEAQAAATERVASPARSAAGFTPVLAGISSAAALRSGSAIGGGGGVAAVTGGGPKRPALLDEDTYELVDRVFFGGLSHALVQTLTVIAQRAPALQPEVQVSIGLLLSTAGAKQR